MYAQAPIACDLSIHVIVQVRQDQHTPDRAIGVGGHRIVHRHHRPESATLPRVAPCSFPPGGGLGTLEPVRVRQGGTMRYEVSERIPQDARSIREAVFVDEQGFHDEFDETDEISLHIVAYDGDAPVGVCRVFPNEGNTWTLGRLAVLKPYRGRHLGAGLVGKAEKTVRSRGADRLTLHAQERVKDFYRSLGYRDMGIHDLDEGCPHMWMDKPLAETVGDKAGDDEEL